MKRTTAFILAVLMCFAVSGCGKGNQTENLATEDGSVTISHTDNVTDETTESDATESSSTLPAAGPDDLVAAAANDMGDVGFINTSGQWVIAPQYAAATPFYEGVAAVCTSGWPYHWQLIDKSGQVLSEFAEDILAAVSAPQQWGNPFRYTAETGSFIADGMLLICDSGYTKYGYANLSGEVVVSPTYSQAYYFSEGLAAVNFGTDSNPSWGFIDKQGGVVIPGAYTYARSFSDGLAYVEWDETDSLKADRGFVDQTGRLVIYGSGTYGELYSVKWSGFYGYLSGFSNGYAVCEYGCGGYDVFISVIDKTGAAVWTDAQDGYWCTGTGAIGDGLFQVYGSDDTYGFIDMSGSLVIPLQDTWEAICPFSEGLCAVRDCVTGKQGYIDASGTVVIPIKYQMAFSFLNGYACLMEDNTYYYIDKTGSVAVTGDFTCMGVPFTR